MKTQTTWREFITNLTSDFAFHPPARLDSIVTAESSLGVAFPEVLKNLLQESDGIEGEYGLGLIWNVERITKDNLIFRQSPDFKNLYMYFDQLLFFADAGNGDQFAFAILNGEIRNPDIFVWDHENDSRRWAAPSLDLYLEWWINGSLKI